MRALPEIDMRREQRDGVVLGDRLFGRLLALDGEKLQLLPLMDGGRQQVVALPEQLPDQLANLEPAAGVAVSGGG